jgi:hypothetical protein
MDGHADHGQVDRGLDEGHHRRRVRDGVINTADTIAEDKAEARTMSPRRPLST